jgi:hypothetical protein
MDINVKLAADIIETVRLALAERVDPFNIELELIEKFGILPITKCNGEAHSNANIDHCMVCAPRWGLTGPKITVRARTPKVK